MRFLVVALTVLVLGPSSFMNATISGQGAFDFSSQGCDLVELYPGYPGYRGYVTGVDGVGDHACLQDLMEQDRRFNKVQVDGANLQTAQLLGIIGGPELWTWENWMAIEAGRGLIPTCYSCLFDVNNIRAEPTQHNVAFNDPRLLLGSPFNSYDGSINQFYTARIEFSLSQAPKNLNAAELLAGINRNSTSGIAGPYVDPFVGWCDALAQGGYAPTPIQAAPDDQIFLLSAPLYLIHLPGLNRFGRDIATNRFEGAATNWRFDRVHGRTTQSFAQFLSSSSLGDGC